KNELISEDKIEIEDKTVEEDIIIEEDITEISDLDNDVEEVISEEILISEERLNAGIIPTNYTITYILNGGENHIDNISILKPGVKLVLKSPKRSGYTFAGWYNKADNTRVLNVSNTNMTIYAKWNPITYIITLVPNGGKYTIPTSSKIEYTNMSSKITLPVPVKQYYTFGGWYKDKAFTQKVDYIYSGSIGNITLYAKWNHISHNIKYYMNDSSTEPVILSSKHVTIFNEASATTLVSPTRTGFAFNGFYETNPNSIYFTGKEKKVTSIPKFTLTDKTLYAKWTENKYKLVYSSNGGAFISPLSALSLKYTDNTRTPLFTALKAREGYSFLGWNTKRDGTGINYGENVNISRLSAKNGSTVTLYANWKAIEYGVYCDYRGGNMFDAKGYPLNPRTHTIEKNITLKNPTKTGYIFGGWYRTKDCSGKKSTVIPKSTSEENFYALWTPIKYSITFNANGGTGKVNSISGCEYDNSYVISDNQFTKKIRTTTFSFKEWNTRPDGTGVTYMPGDVVSNLTAKNKGKVILYAIWVKD
ncbi:MAG: InlB B-repeat-containing protein, partial [Ruminococcus sp.]|nr:InlB B-repeat-containing protein [Ruminococcus sp.]